MQPNCSKLNKICVESQKAWKLNSMIESKVKWTDDWLQHTSSPLANLGQPTKYPAFSRSLEIWSKNQPVWCLQAKSSKQLDPWLSLNRHSAGEYHLGLHWDPCFRGAPPAKKNACALVIVWQQSQKENPPKWASQSTSATLLSGSWAHLPMKTAPSEANLVSALAPKAFGRKTLVRFPKVPHCTGKDLESLHLVQPDQAACYDVFKTWSQTQNFGMPSFKRYSHCRTSIGSKRFRVGYSCTVQNQVYTTGTVVVPLGPAMYLSKFTQYFLEWLWITIRSETNPKKQ